MRRVMNLEDIRWDRYPAVAEQAMARRWIENQVLLGMAPNTVDAYARAVQDFLVFCEQAGVSATEATRDEIARYVGDLRQRPNPRGADCYTLILSQQHNEKLMYPFSLIECSQC